MLAQVFPLASSILMTMITASVLGVTGRGQLAVVLAAAVLIGALGFLSLQVGIVRAYRAGDVSAPRRGFKMALIPAGFVLTLGLGTVAIFPDLEVGLFDGTRIILISVGGALCILNLVILRTRQGLGDSSAFRNAWLIQSCIFPILGIPLALLYHSPNLVVLAWFAAIASSTLFALGRPSDGKTGAPSPSHVRGWAILRDSLLAHVGTTGQQLLHSADTIVLGVISNAAAVGLYSVAVPIASLIWVFSEALSLVAFDNGSRPSGVEDTKRRRAQLVRLNLIVGSAGAVAIGLGSSVLVPFFLPDYKAAVPLILILLPGVVVQGYARIGLSSILARGDQRPVITIGVVSASLSTMYIPFVYLSGATGAAVASSIIYGLQTAVVFFVIRNQMKRIELKEMQVVNE